MQLKENNVLLTLIHKTFCWKETVIPKLGWVRQHIWPNNLYKKSSDSPSPESTYYTPGRTPGLFYRTEMLGSSGLQASLRIRLATACNGSQGIWAFDITYFGSFLPTLRDSACSAKPAQPQCWPADLMLLLEIFSICMEQFKGQRLQSKSRRCNM